ncbi:MAG TPA: proline--tRNA ligase [Bacteroidota bacterium]|nr:proline--tRNA ligase [Bacteroidota bacterium]
MRLSRSFVPTVKETPADAAIPSHQLMIRSGMVRAVAAGVYAFLPLGLRVMEKVIAIVREEMNAIGAQELLLPALSPLELWQQTGRVRSFGETLFHIANRALVLAPTHEEVICALARDHIASYRDMPQIWYQIQTKFRNEPRPRSGVLRGRQFLMKDSYSLDSSRDGLDRSYGLHAGAYARIFDRCGIRYVVAGASSGAMGGTGSQEFVVESEFGEDTFAVSPGGSYAANLEVATSAGAGAGRVDDDSPIREIHTPGVRTIDELAAFLGVDHSLLAKSVVYQGGDRVILVLMMGNDELNETKLSALVGADVRPVEPERLRALTGADGGSIGPVGLRGFSIFADGRLRGANGLISGANRNDYHIAHIDLERDCAIDGYHDLRTVREGEDAPDGSGPLRIVRGIELGHIFKLGTKYSDALGASFLDEKGAQSPVVMGSYGIGLERIIACHIEQHHDADGIVWDPALAPFDVQLLGVGMKRGAVGETAEELYTWLQDAGIDVLYDDRGDVGPGFKFKDADLLGVPYQVIVGERNMAAGRVEIKERRTGSRSLVGKTELVETVKGLVTRKEQAWNR